ncbi:hypothetical protein TFLX_04696 [Thermoflexales bacterium]|nr:hypothetical protein TFLX_04696 [Thermoflexales bacterium]
MNVTYTYEQILALASDASSAQAGKTLATPHKWLSLGRDNRSVWGECRGSGAKPYQAQIDLSEPAFKCSCPSRKFPCKHALGLFLLLADQPATIKSSMPPAWVTDWLHTRDERAQKQAEKKERLPKPVDTEAQSKRAAKREAKIDAGIDELDVWLRDLIRGGLAKAQTQSNSFWGTPAARLVDAQAPGLARRVHELATIPANGPGWQERLLDRLSRLHLLIEGYRQLDTLPDDVQLDVRTQIGWTQNQDEVLAQAGVSDRWLVLGQRTTEEDRLRTQRIWLWGTRTQRPALILNFAYGTQPFSDISLLPSTSVEATLVYFPGAYPLRALLKDRSGNAQAINVIPGCTSLKEAYAAYAAALTQQPWLEQFPLSLVDVVPVQRDQRWFLRDREDRVLPLTASFSKGWHLLALSGGRPITIFGEWNGDDLLPLSVWAADHFVRLSD